MEVKCHDNLNVNVFVLLFCTVDLEDLSCCEQDMTNDLYCTLCLNLYFIFISVKLNFCTLNPFFNNHHREMTLRLTINENHCRKTHCETHKHQPLMFIHIVNRTHDWTNNMACGLLLVSRLTRGS